MFRIAYLAPYWRRYYVAQVPKTFLTTSEVNLKEVFFVM